MKRFAALLLLLGLTTSYNSFSQDIKIPRTQAARIADSLRVLPVVRSLYSAERARVEAATLQADVCASQVQRLGAEALTSQQQQEALRVALASATAYGSEWRGKARRRWWVSAGLGLVLGGVGYLTVVR